MEEKEQEPPTSEASPDSENLVGFRFEALASPESSLSDLDVHRLCYGITLRLFLTGHFPEGINEHVAKLLKEKKREIRCWSALIEGRGFKCGDSREKLRLIQRELFWLEMEVCHKNCQEYAWPSKVGARFSGKEVVPPHRFFNLYEAKTLLLMLKEQKEEHAGGHVVCLQGTGEFLLKCRALDIEPEREFMGFLFFKRPDVLTGETMSISNVNLGFSAGSTNDELWDVLLAHLPPNRERDRLLEMLK